MRRRSPEGPVSIDWLGTEPADPETVDVELESDVIVVGLGWAGVCATRSACEAGASVNVFEKGSYYGLTRQNVNAWGSKLWLELFPETEKYWDKPAAMRAVTQSTLNRASDAIQSRWFDTDGEAFDWFFGAMEGTNVVYGTAENPKVDTSVTHVTETSYPYPQELRPHAGVLPLLPGLCQVLPHLRPLLRRQHGEGRRSRRRQAGRLPRHPRAEAHQGGWPRERAVTPADAEGRVYKATARSGVILATGDFFSNKLMVNAMLSRRFPDGCSTLNSLVDANEQPCNMGDGHRMGAWAGARLQLNGVNMSHAIGGNSYTMGTLPTLFLDKHGKRYMNEDVQGQQHAERIWELKDCIAFQVFDAGLFDHMDDMPYGHGKHPEATLEAIQADAEAGKLFTADTIEGLLDQLDIDKEAALASIARYNELCHAGVDSDYGKCAKRIDPCGAAPVLLRPLRRRRHEPRRRPPRDHVRPRERRGMPGLRRGHGAHPRPLCGGQRPGQPLCGDLPRGAPGPQHRHGHDVRLHCWQERRSRRVGRRARPAVERRAGRRRRGGL